MCGLTGIYAPGGLARDAEDALRRMTTCIRHRGPDDEGFWLDADAGVAVGSRRLAILDLSPLGHQPMVSPTGRYVIAYNGEIYNHLELRRELERAGQSFRGHSDTETFLAAVERWGLRSALERCAGMYALALWDRERRLLHLVRDRLGEKPLYYGWMGTTLVFGSELKALKSHPAWNAEIDRGALTLLLRYGYIAAPYSIYSGVRKARPATILTFGGPGGDPIEERYWSPRAAAEGGMAHAADGRETDIVDGFEAALRRTVRQQMLADVPVGAFLSGGIDSSTIVALMQQESTRPVRTFTIGFHETDYNEAEHAKAVSRHLGTDHTELYLTPEETRAVIPRLPEIFDEPFADSSQIPTFLVSRLARQHVTVSLSGDGGDELFGGYDRYAFGRTLWRRVGRVPRPARMVTGRGLAAVSAGAWNGIARTAVPLLPPRLHPPLFGHKMHVIASLLRAPNAQELYRNQMSLGAVVAAAVIGGTEPVTPLGDAAEWLPAADPVLRMMYLDLVTYLPDDLLVKTDRASMAVSLETRAPFLDHRIVEHAWRVPSSLKFDAQRGKLLLRHLLARYVPPSLTERPKMGFGVPIGDWLRGPLKAWAESLLDRDTLVRDGLLDPAPIERVWREHQSMHWDWQYALWNVLMLQAWIHA
jgi:asparagine synthase (glutamine-hydrolysing)